MPNWMTNVHAATAGGASPFGNRPLNQITIPGTHDAGCYVNRTPQYLTTLSKTQTQNIAQQLTGGIRYFDLRPCKSGQEFWTYHGPYWGGRLDGGAGIIHDVANFMGGVAGVQELVVLNFSHFSAFNGADHHRLINEILLRLGPFLVPHNQHAFNLFNSAYDVVLSPPGAVAPVSRVAVLYDGALDTPREDLCPAGLPDGCFELNPKSAVAAPNQTSLFDKYANQGTLAPMQNNQMNKLANRAAQVFSTQPWPGAGGNWTNNDPWAIVPTGILNTWHLFSWTLTPQPWDGPVHAAQTLSNPALEGWFTGNHWPTPLGAAVARPYDPTLDQRINVIYVDDYASTLHACAAGGGCARANYAVPVALCDFINRFFIAAAWPGWGAY